MILHLYSSLIEEICRWATARLVCPNIVHFAAQIDMFHDLGGWPVVAVRTWVIYRERDRRIQITDKQGERASYGKIHVFRH
jgi:hypothetical protein